ncbi:MAG TPA: MTH1187 family thiamine-binding protein [Proteobacteria bacterium]|nr:hypothetical protein BMS3Abin14_00130 [bacterium BMS3Abin14]HDL53644.1 MTH1187 family thiamine-binding protein [Pseudomonadota bacterium]
MAIAEISVVPLGTGSPSLSGYVAECVRALKDSGVTYTLTPMGTIIEGSLDEILDVVRMLHRVTINQGAVRVYTRVAIDDRRDKDSTAEGKLESVRSRLAST